MTDQEKNCFLCIDEKKYGPFSTTEIQSLYDTGKINGSAQFIRAGTKEWIPLANAGVVSGLEETPAVPVGETDAPEAKKKGRRANKGSRGIRLKIPFKEVIKKVFARKANRL